MDAAVDHTVTKNSEEEIEDYLYFFLLGINGIPEQKIN